MIESKIHVRAGDLRGLVSDSIKNDLALGELKPKVPSEIDICRNAASAQAKNWTGEEPVLRTLFGARAILGCGLMWPGPSKMPRGLGG